MFVQEETMGGASTAYREGQKGVFFSRRRFSSLTYQMAIHYSKTGGAIVFLKATVKQNSNKDG